MGDKTGFLNKRHYAYENWNTDNPEPHLESFTRLYKSVPFLIGLKNKRAIKGIAKAGLSHLYLEEIYKHLLELFPYRMTSQEMINLYGLAGAQYNIIFNLFLPRSK